MSNRDKPLVCPHGRKIGIQIDPAEFSPGGNYIVHKVTMPVCDQCLLEALGLADGQSTGTEGKA